MQVRSIKFAALLLANTAALALSSALPVESFPQWVTIEGEAEDLIYDFNSFKFDLSIHKYYQKELLNCGAMDKVRLEKM